MKPRIICYGALALLLAGCGANDRKAEDSVVAIVDSVEAADSVMAVSNLPFEVKKFEKKVGENELEIQYPTGGNPEVVKAVRNWINESLGESYKGNLDDGQALFNHYAADLGTNEELEEYGGFTQDDFELEYVSDYVVTYEHASYEYEGGAHGMGGTYGTSFRQTDGKTFSKKCFTSYKPLHSLFIEGLKRYFKVNTDAQLLQQLNGVKSLASLADPGREPWITEEGVEFSYTPYEIAPYSAGNPRFTIPYSKLEPYLTEEGKTFFGK